MHAIGQKTMSVAITTVFCQYSLPSCLNSSFTWGYQTWFPRWPVWKKKTKLNQLPRACWHHAYSCAMCGFWYPKVMVLILFRPRIGNHITVIQQWHHVHTGAGWRHPVAESQFHPPAPTKDRIASASWQEVRYHWQYPPAGRSGLVHTRALSLSLHRHLSRWDWPGAGASSAGSLLSLSLYIY
jgi:hypothetical protein